MKSRDIFAGIDIGSSMIRVIILEARSDSGFALLGYGEAQSDGMRRGAVVDSDVASKSIMRALRDARKHSGIDIRHATVSITEQKLNTYIAKGSISVSRADGEVADEDITRVMESAEASLPKLANREIIQSFPLSYSLDKDTGIRDPRGLIGTKLESEVVFVTTFSHHLKNIVRAVERAGIDIDDVVAAPFASGLHVLSKKQKEIGSAVIDIGAQVTTLGIFEEGSLVSLEIIPIGSGHITYDIGLGFQIDHVSAERVKRNLAPFFEQGKKEIRLTDLPKNFEESFSPKKLREIVSARLGDIFELIGKHLKKIGRAELLPGGVVLVGGGARLLDIATAARESLNLPAEVGKSGGILMPKDLVLGPEWFCAIGLAKYGKEAHENAGRAPTKILSGFSGRIAKIFRAFIP